MNRGNVICEFIFAHPGVGAERVYLCSSGGAYQVWREDEVIWRGEDEEVAKAVWQREVGRILE